MKPILLLGLVSIVIAGSCADSKNGSTVNNCEESAYKERKNYLGPTLYGNVRKLISVTYSITTQNGEYVEDERLERAEYSFNSHGDLVEYSYKDYEDRDDSYRETYQYDSNRNMLKYRRYDSDANIVEILDCSYDKSGNLIEESGYGGKTCYQYKNGRLVRKVSYDDGKEERYETFDYDSNGRQIESYEFDYSSSIGAEKTLKEYDSDGNLVTEVYYIGGEMQYAHVYVYDSASNCIQKQCFDGLGKLEEYCISEYDQDKLIQSVWLKDDEVYASVVHKYDSEGNLQYSESYSTYESVRSEFDENGRLIKYVRFDSNGELKEATTYVYDNKGNEIERYTMENTSYGGESQYKNECKYDHHGNCVESLWYRDSMHSPDEITKYTISYY